MVRWIGRSPYVCGMRRDERFETMLKMARELARHGHRLPMIEALLKAHGRTALEERRKRLARLLSRSNRAMRQGIQLSEAITGDGAAIFRHACGLGLDGIVSKRIGSLYVSGRTRAWLKTKNPRFRRV